MCHKSQKLRRIYLSNMIIFLENFITPKIGTHLEFCFIYLGKLFI